MRARTSAHDGIGKGARRNMNLRVGRAVIGRRVRGARAESVSPSAHFPTLGDLGRFAHARSCGQAIDFKIVLSKGLLHRRRS